MSEFQIRHDMLIAQSPHPETVSGGIVTFTPNAAYPLKSCRAIFEPLQSGSGNASPSNVRPITGWTVLNVYRSGKNVIPYDVEFTDNYFITSSGAVSYNDAYKYTADYLPIAPSTTYTCQMERLVASNVAFSVAMYDKSFTFVERQVAIRAAESSVGLKTGQITTPSNVRYIRISVPVYTSVINYQIEVGSTATSYEAFSGRTFPVTWQSEAGTVYGGYVDMISGELVQTYGHKAFTGSETYTDYSTVAVCESVVPQGLSLSGSDLVCSHGLFSSGAVGWSDSSLIKFQFDYSAFGASGLSELIALFQAQDQNGTPVQITYKLAEPISYQLTAQKIASLTGMNTVWNNASTTSVTYWTH